MLEFKVFEEAPEEDFLVGLVQIPAKELASSSLPAALEYVLQVAPSGPAAPCPRGQVDVPASLSMRLRCRVLIAPSSSGPEGGFASILGVPAARCLLSADAGTTQVVHAPTRECGRPCRAAEPGPGHAPKELLPDGPHLSDCKPVGRLGTWPPSSLGRMGVSYQSRVTAGLHLPWYLP